MRKPKYIQLHKKMISLMGDLLDRIKVLEEENLHMIDVAKRAGLKGIQINFVSSNGISRHRSALSWSKQHLPLGSSQFLLFLLLLSILGEVNLSLIHISEPTRLGMISYAVFCLKKK